MSGNIKEFNTYSVTSPIVKVGSSIDSRGRTLNITPEVARDIFDQLNGAAPLKDIHGDGEPIASMRKFILKEDGIYQKSIVNDVQRFESRYKDGHFYISPELEVEFDNNDRVIGATLSGAAFTNNPGMIKERPMIEQLYFEGPSGEQTAQSPTPTSTQPSGNTWQEPLGELKKTINNLNDTLSTFGERMNSTVSTNNANVNNNAPTPESTPNTVDSGKVTLSVDDLAKMVDEAVAKKMAANVSTSSTPPPIPEASETAGSNSDELAKQYAELLAKTQNLEANQEKLDKKAFNSIVAELKAVGIEHPEKMLPDASLTTAQKTTILESIKENFAKNSPMSAPLQEPISSGATGSQQKQNALTVDSILASESFESDNDPQLRHKLLRLSDPELMRKYNMNVLFDTNGTYIGPI